MGGASVEIKEIEDLDALYLKSKIKQLNREIVSKNNTILRFIGMSFICRLKFLLTGKVDV